MKKLALALLLATGPAVADTNLCWDTARNNWQKCANDLPVLARATAGVYGDWNGGTNRLWQEVPNDWAVYACEADLPVGHGDGCPTPGVYTQEKFKLKSELVGVIPPPPPPSPPGDPAWTGEATLTWTPPVTRADGSPLTDLAGYNVYYGQTQPLGWLREVPAPASGTVVTGLAAGTWMFEITAKDAGGRESEHSNTATVVLGEVVPPPPPPGPKVVAVVAGLSHSPVFGVTASGTRGTTVLGFIPVGADALAKVYSYRGKQYCKVPRASVVWWASSPTDNAAAACQ